MSASRKGLKRAGMRAYRVDGPHGAYIIERERRAFFTVRREGVPRDFFNEGFRALWIARLAAENWAGAMPYFLRRSPE